MFRVRFANIICSSTNDGQGLLGVIKNVSVTPEIKVGFINASPQNMGTSFSNTAAKLLEQAGFNNNISEGKKILIPKVMKISFSLDVVHDHPLGWDFHTGEWRGGSQAPRFPYDFGLHRDARDTPSAGEAVFEGATSEGDKDLSSSGPGADASSPGQEPAAAPGSPEDRQTRKSEGVILDEKAKDRGAEKSKPIKPAGG
jgi:hypothetical protein